MVGSIFGASFRLRIENASLNTVQVRARLIRRTIVKSSTGEGEERCVVRTLARVGEHEFPVELTLDARPKLLCRMLLGRRALAGRFLVDCGRRYILTTPAKTRLRGSPAPSRRAPKRSGSPNAE